MTTPKILVKDYMRPLAVTFSPRSRVEEVVEGLLQHRVTGAPVIDDQQKLVGFVSEQDCIKEMLNDSYYGQDHQLAEDVMRTNVLFATPDTDIMQLAEKMLQERPKLYPVCDDGKLVGLITRSDVLRCLSEVRRSSRNHI